MTIAKYREMHCYRSIGEFLSRGGRFRPIPAPDSDSFTAEEGHKRWMVPAGGGRGAGGGNEGVKYHQVEDFLLLCVSLSVYVGVHLLFP